MKVTIETTSSAFVIRSIDALDNLRSQYQKHVIKWAESRHEDGYIYTITRDEFVAFFDGDKAVTANIVFDVAGKTRDLAVEDVELEFGDKLFLSAEKHTITAYVSMKSTVRIGWDWFGATAAIVDDAAITRYEMTDAGLVLDFKLQTKFFKATSLDLYTVGSFIEEPSQYVVSDFDVSKNENDNTYQYDISFVIPRADIVQMRDSVKKHEMGQKTFEFKFKLNIAEYKLTKDTIRWMAEKSQALKQPLLYVMSDDEDDFVLATRVSGYKNLMLIPALLNVGEYAATRQQLLDTKITDDRTKTVLLDQGSLSDRQHVRQLFKALVLAKPDDVFLLTDGQYTTTWSDIERAQVVYAHTKEHIRVYPQIKTLVTMGNRHDALPLGAQSVIPMSIKHHIRLIDDLKRQIEVDGLDLAPNGMSDFFVANQQAAQLVKRVYPNQTTVHVTGLPGYDLIEQSAPIVDTIGVGVDETIMASVESLSKRDIISLNDGDNLRQFELVITSQYDTAKRASVLGVPTVYVDAELTAETVDHYYELTGPVIRDVVTGASILKRALADEIDFDNYVARANNNLNKFHDILATERIVSVLR